MMMEPFKHLVVCPFSRPWNANILAQYMRGQGVTWCPLTTDTQHLPPAVLASPELPIVTFHKQLPPNCPFPANWILDEWINQVGKHLDESTYVSFMTDDCLWNYNYFRKLQKYFIQQKMVGGRQIPGGIQSAVILSTTTAPNGQGGIGVVYPSINGAKWHEKSYRTFATRFEALTVRGDLVKTIHFGELWCADGLIIEKLVEDHREQGSVAFADDAVVYFNALDSKLYGFPGKWDDATKRKEWEESNKSQRTAGYDGNKYSPDLRG